MCNCPEGYFDLTPKIDAYGGIPNYGCENDLTISAIWILNTVKSIGTRAFYGCENLERIEFEDGGDAGLSIGLMAFENCSKLREVKFPSRLSSIGAACFRGCTALERIEFNGGNFVFRDPGHVFDGCPQKDALLSMLRTECTRRSAVLAHVEFGQCRTGKSPVNEVRWDLKDGAHDYCKSVRQIIPSRADSDPKKESSRDVKEHWNSFRNNDDESELRKVLSGNPFTQEIVKEWWEILQGAGDRRFVLPCDENLLQDIIESETRANYRILPNLLPQPFVGDPRGDIWLLLYNPGYTPIDDFDNISVADKDGVFKNVRDMILSEIRNEDERTQRKQSYGQLNSSDLFVARSPEEDMECLRRRQTFMLNQLLLNIDKDLPFFWLDESFRTVKVNVFGQKLVGGHLWWKRRLNGFLRKGNDVGRIFVMEYFPYHSRNFEHNQLGKWAGESCYHKFWQAMIEYGQKHGKRIIVRNSWMVNGTVDARILNCAEYFEFRSMNCSLSLKNIEIGS